MEGCLWHTCFDTFHVHIALPTVYPHEQGPEIHEDHPASSLHNSIYCLPIMLNTREGEMRCYSHLRIQSLIAEMQNGSALRWAVL